MPERGPPGPLIKWFTPKAGIREAISLISTRLQFITLRLADSLPRMVAAALRHREDDVHRIDRELDLGVGVCWLAMAEIAAIVQAALLHFDSERYRLLAWSIMPNHVHVLIEVLPNHSVSDIVRSWKSFTASRSNEGHLVQTIEYVEQNPVKAGLVSDAGHWAWSSARFRRSSDS